MKKYSLLLLLVCFLPFYVPAQIITTIAGNGIIGNTGDGDLAVNAEISYPIGGVFDKIGNYYFATSSTGNTIRKISSLGIITTVAGTGLAGYSGDGGLATNAMLSRPQSVAIDTLGNLYIADAGNNRIRKVNITDGVITTIAGSGIAGYGGDGGPAISAKILSPLDICFDKFGNLYIADDANARVRKVNSSGIISTFAGTGAIINSQGGGMADTTPIVGVTGLCSDLAGNVYIANSHSRVYRVSLSGFITTIVGTGISGFSGDGGLASDANTIPFKLAKDRYGNLFIAEYDIDRLRMVNSSGIITTIAGNGVAGFSGDGHLASSSLLNHPSGLALDTCDNLYIADGRNHRIRKIEFNPTCAPIYVQDIEIPSTDICIYPNPVKNDLTVKSLHNLNYIYIFDIFGRELFSKLYKNSEKEVIKLEFLPPGIYFIKVNNVIFRNFYKE